MPEIGYQDTPERKIASREFLLVKGPFCCTIEVVGILLHDSLKGHIIHGVLPLSVPQDLLENLEAACRFLLETPIELLNPHLTTENLT